MKLLHGSGAILNYYLWPTTLIYSMSVYDRWYFSPIQGLGLCPKEAFREDVVN